MLNYQTTPSAQHTTIGCGGRRHNSDKTGIKWSRYNALVVDVNSRVVTCAQHLCEDSEKVSSNNIFDASAIHNEVASVSLGLSMLICSGKRSILLFTPNS